MAEVVGLVGSIITVVSTADNIVKTLARIKNMSDTPAQLLALINEVSDLSILLSDADRYARQVSQHSSGNFDQLEHLALFVDRAKSQLQKLDELIHYKLTKADSTIDLPKISVHNWMKAKSTIEEHRQELRDARLNIASQLALINSYVLSHSK